MPLFSIKFYSFSYLWIVQNLMKEGPILPENISILRPHPFLIPLVYFTKKMVLRAESSFVCMTDYFDLLCRDKNIDRRFSLSNQEQVRSMLFLKPLFHLHDHYQNHSFSKTRFRYPFPMTWVSFTPTLLIPHLSLSISHRREERGA